MWMGGWVGGRADRGGWVGGTYRLCELNHLGLGLLVLLLLVLLVLIEGLEGG